MFNQKKRIMELEEERKRLTKEIQLRERHYLELIRELRDENRYLRRQAELTLSLVDGALNRKPMELPTVEVTDEERAVLLGKDVPDEQ